MPGEEHSLRGPNPDGAGWYLNPFTFTALVVGLFAGLAWGFHLPISWVLVLVGLFHHVWMNRHLVRGVANGQ